MGWVKLDDGFMLNRKSRQVGVEGRMLYIASLCFCAQQENDGRFPSRELPMLAAMAEVDVKMADSVVAAGLWNIEGDEFVVPDYLDYNPSREQAVARRKADRQRQASHRASRRDTEPESRDVSERPVPSRPPGVLPPSSEDSFNREPELSTDDGIPEGTWDAYAERKLSLTNGINSPAKWKAKVAKNAAQELGEDARALLRDFDAGPRELGVALLARERGEQWSLTRKANA